MKRFLVSIYSLIVASALVLLFQSKAHERPDVERFDDPAAHMRWEYERLRDPATGEIPRNIRAKELAFAASIDERSYRSQLGLIHASDWSFAGPINAGGRAQSIGVDISNENNLVVATAQGGIWRSTDAGSSWKRSSTPDQLHDCFSLVQDHRTGKTTTWYCGTGELLSTTFRRASYVTAPRWRTMDVGNGIYKSTDDGASFSLLSSTFDQTPVDLDSAFDGVWNIVVDNSNATEDVVYAAGYGAIVRSTDGGESWQHVLGDRNQKSFCTDVTITSRGVLYAYLSTAGGSATTSGVWRSVDGEHWTRITPANWPASTVRMKLAIAPSNENIVYIAGEAPDNASGHAIWKYTYKSGDGSGSGGSWEDRSASLPTSLTPGLELINTLGGYALALAVHPLDPDVVFLGGTDLYRSRNGFADAQKIDWIGGYNPQPNSQQSYPNHHPDNHCFTFSTRDPERMYNCNDAGAFVTDSSRALGSAQDPYHPVVWSNLNAGLTSSIIYTAAIDHATPGDNVVAGGFQDQGAWIGRPGTPWGDYTGGDGCYTAIADNKSAYYTSSQFAAIYRMRLDKDLNFVSYSFISDRFANPQFVAPWLIDPTNNSQMYVADSSVIWWNSNLDSIPENNYNYTAINWSVLTQCALNRQAEISALAMSVVPQHHLYYGTSDGRVYSLANTSSKPNELTSAIFPKNAFVSCVSVDPEDASHLIVCFSNYHVRSLFASDDAGKSWRDISGNLEQNPDGSGDGPSTRWVSVVHQKGQTLYLVGTSVGLYSTSDISSNVQWHPESPNGIGRTIVEHMDVRQSDGFVAVATQGAGIWYGTVVSDTTASVASPAPSEVALYPNPVQTDLHIDLPHAGDASIVVYDVSGHIVLQKLHTAERVLDCSSLTPGTYLAWIRQSDIETRKRFVVRR